jgi:hypothetical protein
MKNNFKKIIIVTGILGFFFSTGIVFALPAYEPLVPLPGTTLNNNTTDFNTYLPGLFNLSIGISAALAFVMITIGGIMYSTSDAITGKSQGRQYIQNALVGLLLVIGAYTILYTINPQILDFKFELKSPSISPSGANTGTPGVTVNPAGGTNLPSGVMVKDNTIDVSGLQSSAIQGLASLQSACGCTVVITSGEEGSHTTNSTHYNGTGVDLSPSAGIESVVGHPTTACQIFNSNGGRFLWEPKGSLCGGTVASTADHWHATFQ